MSGWFAVKRGTLSHELFVPKGPFSRYEAWVWMIENACYRPQTIDIGGKPYTVPRGCLCYSRRFIASKWHWTRKATDTFLQKLEAHHVIKLGEAKTGTGTKSKRSLITICNYEKYQSDGAKKGPKGGQKGAKEEQGNKETTIPVGETGVSEPIEFSIITKTVWQFGKAYLASKGVNNPGGPIGRWLKTSQPVEVLSAIEAAQKAGTEDPIPYITQILKPNSQQPSAAEIMDRIRGNLEGLQ